MPSLFVDADRQTIFRRLEVLKATTPAKWGKFTPGAMLCHLSQSTELALGELSAASKGKRVFQVFPLKQLIIYVFPFPKGAPTAPELLTMAPGDFEADRARFRDLVTRFAAGRRDGAGPVHPLLGPLSRKEWGVLGYKHTDHHLRQFGA